MGSAARRLESIHQRMAGVSESEVSLLLDAVDAASGTSTAGADITVELGPKVTTLLRKLGDLYQSVRAYREAYYRFCWLSAAQWNALHEPDFDQKRADEDMALARVWKSMAAVEQERGNDGRSTEIRN